MDLVSARILTSDIARLAGHSYKPPEYTKEEKEQTEEMASWTSTTRSYS